MIADCLNAAIDGQAPPARRPGRTFTPRPLHQRGDKISPAERKVLVLAASGLMNKQIAAQLGMAVKTVEKHRCAIYTKLDIHDAVTLAHFAIRCGLVELRDFAPEQKATI